MLTKKYNVSQIAFMFKAGYDISEAEMVIDKDERPGGL